MLTSLEGNYEDKKYKTSHFDSFDQKRSNLLRGSVQKFRDSSLKFLGENFAHVSMCGKLSRISAIWIAYSTHTEIFNLLLIDEFS